MLSKVLNTPIDDLVVLIKNNKNCTTTFLREKLNLPYEIIEKWLIILEEYKIIKIHYKGFEGFVELVEKKEDADKEDEELNIENLKETFTSKCKKRDLSYDQMKIVWPKFVENYKGEINKLFYISAQKRGFDKIQTQKAWSKYLEALIKY
ncbi:MAG: hypothetical protein PF569_06040 [Candidatus Woesearchaeota archaeon]|jgi:hypothetical protein|nr:hypothetical protein [Candidatus Woesearchaeota archaeon]